MSVADSAAGIQAMAHDRRLPTVSVVLAVLNEEQYIERCLVSMLDQSYPADLVEIIVADGGSTDGTLEIIERIAAEHPQRVRVIANPARIQAAGLNAAVRASRGEVIARQDGHAAWPHEHLARCVRLLEETGAANVGGQPRAVGDTPTGRGIALAIQSPLGVGGARHRWSNRQQETATVWPGCYRRDVFEALGGYDETLDIHEDYELNYRLRRQGWRIVFSPEVPADYWVRGSFRALWTQFYRYGRGKARVAARRPGVVRPYHLAPPAFATAIVSTPLLWRIRDLRRPLVLLASGYAALCVAESARLNVTHGERQVLRCAAAFPVMHASWGLGFLGGMVRSVLASARSGGGSRPPSASR